MYYTKRFILQYLAKYKTLTFLFHKLWIFFCYLRSKYQYIKFFKLNKKINSLSDRGQDKWVIDIFELKNKKYKGFFLEIGAGDGFSNSNSFILENYYNWRGILVEPDPEQFKILKKNRPKAKLANKLIYENQKNLPFHINGELSKIVEKKINSKNILVLKSISLKNLLKSYNAPHNIDFFSLDVEGSEDNVLTEDVLNNYTFLSLCIERPSYKLHKLLKKKNYYFIRSNIYDFFYINKKLKNFKKIYAKRKQLSAIYKNK